jgi:hypothetical protein
VDELAALVATLTPDGQSLLRSVRARAQAAGLRERYEPGRAGRGELVLLHGTVTESAVEVARLQLKAGTLPRIWFAPQAPTGATGSAAMALVEAKEIAGLKDAAAAGEKLKAIADARRAAEPQLDLFGNRK